MSIKIMTTFANLLLGFCPYKDQKITFPHLSKLEFDTQKRKVPK